MTGAKKTSSAVIKTLRLQARTGQIADLDSYLIELNVHEDIFGNAVHGTLLVSDNYNLIRDLPIEGTETLMIHIKTTNYANNEEIELKKDFRVFNITDRNVNFEKGNQTYILHFCSWEVFKDAFRPLFIPFQGPISEIATEIFDTYLATPRYAGGANSELKILDDTNNEIKFISPGWTPFKILNWLASKAISSQGKAMNYLFWESTNGYYFGSIEQIFRELAWNGPAGSAGSYRYVERNVNISNFAELDEREFTAINAMKVINVQDQLKLNTSGQLANQVFTIDINKKDFFTTNYIHPIEFSEYAHLQGDGVPAWGEADQSFTQPENAILFYPKNTRLYDDFENNINEVYHQIFGRRVANLSDINNFKINISIVGRTDLRAGMTIYLEWPDTILKSNTAFSDPGFDPHYSGYYLITAIRHKITYFNYVCICEVVKDAFAREFANQISDAFMAGPDQSDAETARLQRQAAGE
jgi:hypothetical protein